MAGVNTIRRVMTAASGAAAALRFAPPLATRVVLGLAFVQTGMGKWRNIEGTTEFFAGLGIPWPGANAQFIATLELVGGILLIAGLLTRLFAAGLTCTMITALLTAEREGFLASWSAASETSPTDIAAFTFLIFLLWLVVFGPGAASLDALLSRAARRRVVSLRRCERTPARSRT